MKNETNPRRLLKPSLLEKLKSTCSEKKLRTKIQVDQDEVISLLRGIKKGDLKKGIMFMDARPALCSYPPITSAGNDLNSREMIEYIKESFYLSEGIYRIFYNKRKKEEFHEFQLKRISDDGGPLYIGFYKNLP